MNLSKSREFFDPDKDTNRIHITGCGSVGSTIAEGLIRCGKTKLTLWDFDKVEAKNVHNQMFFEDDIGKLKVDALKEQLVRVNPMAEDDIILQPEGWNGKNLSGYIFLCVDSIELRQQIVKQHFDNFNIKAVFDIRTLLTGAQHYAADWSNREMKENLLRSMNFTHEEATAATPVSACGTTLGIVTTVRIISALAINNYIRFCKGEGIWKYVDFDGFAGMLDCF